MGGFRTIQDVQGIYDSKGVELALNSLTQATLQNSGAGLLNEIGVMAAFGGAVPPTGWLICDGSAVSRTIFAALYAVIGTNYGVGDGSTTFNLPDKGRDFFGLDTSQTEFNTLGKKGGHKLLQAHIHQQSVANGVVGGTALSAQVNNTGGNFGVSNWTQSTGGGNGENLPPYQVVNWIIRYAAPTGVTTGIGNWQPWLPVWSNLTVGNGVQSSSYTQIGKTVTVRLHLLFGSTTSISGAVGFELPVKAATQYGTSSYMSLGITLLTDEGTSVNVGQLYTTLSAVNAKLGTIGTAGTYANNANVAVSAAVPHTWAVTDAISATFTYEAA